MHSFSMRLCRKENLLPRPYPSKAKIPDLLFGGEQVVGEFKVTFLLDHFLGHLEGAVGDIKPSEGKMVAPVHDDKLPFSLAQNS